MRFVAIVVLALLAPAAGLATTAHLTARYESVHKGSGYSIVDRGEFDWTARHGTIVETLGRSKLLEVREIGADCYTQIEGGKWRHTKADAVTRLCPHIPGNPLTDWKLMERVASRWQRVGVARIDGVVAVHYRSRVDIGGLRGDGDWWIDRAGRLRKVVTRDTPEHPDSVTTSRYRDFGVRVSVVLPPAPS